MNTRRTDSSRARTLGAAAALFFAFVCNSIAAAPGSLLPGFGTGGKAFTNFTFRESHANAVALSDGKLIVAGGVYNGTDYDFAVTRLNADGSTDASFGALGRVTIDFGGNEMGQAVAVQSDGKIVIGGRRYTGTSNFLLARLLPSGAIDGTFGIDGKVETTVAFHDSLLALAIQADGKIVAAGTSNSSDFAMARYNSDGTLDADFGCAAPGTCSGKFVTDLGATFETAYAVRVQGDGKIVAAGGSGLGASADFALVRYNSNGTLDHDFGCATAGTCAGFVKTAIGSGEDEARALLVQPDGKLVAGGYSRGAGSDYSFALARYLPNGILDSSFGLGGKVTTNFGIGYDAIQALALQGDGKIVATGTANTPNDFAVARYGTTGFLDPDFGCATPGSCSGSVVTSMSTANDIPYAVAIQGDGKVVVAGTREIVNPLVDMAILRFNANGTPDTSYGAAGQVFATFLGSDDYASAIVHANSRLVVAGSTFTPSSDFAVAKYFENGALDTSFGSGGRATVDFGGGDDFAYAVLVQPADNKVILVGYGVNVSGFDFAIARLLADGQMDTSFGIGGKVFAAIGSETDEAFAAALQPDGKIVAAGLAYDATTTNFALARFNANGSLDASFGTGGKLTTVFSTGDSGIQALALQSDGKLVAAGYAGPPGAGQEMALARYNANGTLDTDFGCPTPGACTGKVTLNAGSIFAAFNAVKLAGDGKIIAAGYIYSGSTPKFNFVVARFHANGVLDTSFGASGVASVSFGSEGDQGLALALDNLGRILVSGDSGQPSFAQYAAVARLNPNGALDASFGAAGKVLVPAGADTSHAQGIAFIPSSSRIVIAGWATNADYSGSNDFLLAGLDGSGPLVISAARGDFDGDGKADLVFEHTDGRSAVWLMDGLTPHATADVFGAGTAWRVRQIADLSGDDKSDLVWQHPDGRVTVYIMNGTTAAPKTQILGAGGWRVVEAGDMNGDNKADLVFQHSDGTVAVWLMNGTSMTSGGTILGPGTGWSVTRMADFDGDGKKDLLFTHTDGRVAIWLMDGLTPTVQNQILNAGSGWSVTHTPDLNGDGKADIVWEHTDGRVAAWLMNGAVMSSGAEILGPGTGWSVTRTGDFDGDGKGDLFFLHTDGRAAIYLMNGLVPSTTTQILNAGGGWSAKRIADLNGDGKFDIVWENTDGRVAVWLMDGTLMTSGAEILGPGTGWSVSRR